jgi:hypothetical protein
MGISDLAIIRFVFYINAAKKKISIHNFDFGFGKIIDAVASLNPPVAGYVGSSNLVPVTSSPMKHHACKVRLLNRPNIG